MCSKSVHSNPFREADVCVCMTRREGIDIAIIDLPLENGRLSRI